MNYNNQTTSKYFRITAYHPELNITVIMDSNGKFEKLWQFSSYVISKGFKILEVGKDDQFRNINIEKAEYDKTHIILQASAIGKPNYSGKTIDGITHKVIEIDEKQYIPE